MVKKSIKGLFLLVIMSLSGCVEDDGGGGNGDTFDREAILVNWADNIILPAYEQYVSSLEQLDVAATEFELTPTVENLEKLREAWLASYTDWQSVSMFEIGKAEEVTLRNFTNVFPVNIEDMEATISSGTYNLSSVNKQDEQGFPALDYLINGLAATDQEIVTIFLLESAESNHGEYLTTMVDNLQALTNEVYNDWLNGYRDVFVENSGSDASSSINKVINDLLFYYERHLRAGKIGIPAGVFSGTPLSDRVEALYSRGDSKTLFNASLTALRDFFNGKHFGSSETGESLKSYLDFLNTIKDGEDLSGIINDQFDGVQNTADLLNDDFEAQVNEDNIKMLNIYDQLQVNVVYMKVDMLQALDVRVDYIDADGD